MKVAIICNSASHVRDVVGINPNHPDLVVITPENTDKMHGLKDIYYYPMRPLYAREVDYGEQHNWSSINKTELFELLGVNRD